ncbi:hypothetical protein SEA_A3WALLY_311 [Microbacterium phage A3Wally]|nr:hypothetical protein SEA_A3WALLY_311 [Microbacterium phage A3Wally]
MTETQKFSTHEALTSEHYRAKGNEDGSITISKVKGPHDEAVGRGGTISVKEARALSYVFENQKDIDLGRFRSNLAPIYVVYPDRDARRAENWATLLNELTGDSVYINRKAVMQDPAQEDVRKAYFATIPVRGPWEDANHGDVWLLTRSESKEAYTMDRREPEIYPAGVWRNLDTYMAGNSDDIKSGKPIYTAENN